MSGTVGVPPGMAGDDHGQTYARQLAKLGRAVREAREQRGLSQRELADTIRGISPAGIRAIEAGRCDIDYERLLRLADALDVQLSTLARRAGTLSAE